MSDQQDVKPKSLLNQLRAFGPADAATLSERYLQLCEGATEASESTKRKWRKAIERLTR